MDGTLKKLAETETSNIRGSSDTVYGLQPRQFMKDVVDAAKNIMYFGSTVRNIELPKGVHSISIPKRTLYKGYYGGTWNTAGTDTGASTGAGTGPYANTIADISWQTVDNADNVTATPLPYIAGSAIRRFDLDTNVINYVDFVKDELKYQVWDRVEYDIATTIGDATDATSTAAGAQTIFGGDATSGATLESGDVLTTSLIAKAAEYLKSEAFRYRASTGHGAESKADVSSYRKNPWQNTPDDPFVLFIGPAQERVLRESSQFVNASEYGGREVILNGEIGKLTYLGIKLIVSNRVESVASGGTPPDGNSTAGTDMTRCILMKPKHACALVWGKKPEMRVWDYNERDQVRMAMYYYYDVTVIHDDAIVFIDVADA